MAVCLVCLGPSPSDIEDLPYHRDCLQGLFGAPVLPKLDVGLADIPAIASESAGKISISGAQRKLLLGLSRRRTRLLPTKRRSTYLLKPQLETYANVPENEHASMCAARVCGLETPPLGLVKLNDGTWAYLIKRYDRTDDDPPRKLLQLDFCQLAGRPSSQRGHGTAEECAALVQRFSARPEVEQRRLFLHLLFAYWIGNGDLHLKNLSLLRDPGGDYRLSPAYDLLSTWIYKDKTMTMPVLGREKDLRRAHWLDFAEMHASIPRSEAAQILASLVSKTAEVVAVLKRSALPESLRSDFQRIVKKRTRALEQ